MKMMGLLIWERILILKPHFRSASLTISMCFENFVAVWNSKYNLVTMGCWISLSEKEHHSSRWHITVWIMNIISVQHKLQHLWCGSNQQATQCFTEHIHHHILVCDLSNSCTVPSFFSTWHGLFGSCCQTDLCMGEISFTCVIVVSIVFLIISTEVYLAPQSSSSCSTNWILVRWPGPGGGLSKGTSVSSCHCQCNQMVQGHAGWTKPTINV